MKTPTTQVGSAITDRTREAPRLLALCRAPPAHTCAYVTSARVCGGRASAAAVRSSDNPAPGRGHTTLPPRIQRPRLCTESLGREVLQVAVHARQRNVVSQKRGVARARAWYRTSQWAQHHGTTGRKRSPECVPAPPYAAHSRAEPEEPHRSAGAPQTRATPSKSSPQPLGSARAGAQSQSPRAITCTGGPPLRRQGSALRRLTPRRHRNRRAAPQAHPDARRTLQEPRGPPGVDAGRACQDRAIQTPGVTPAAPRKACPERHEPRASCTQPAPTRRKRPESQRSSARVAAASAHTPTARRRLAPLRPAPYDAAPRRRHTQTRAAP